MLNSAFSNNFSGIVWRIKADEVLQLIAVETRDPDKGNPAFSVIHYPTGRVMLDELPYGDRWWTIAGIHQGLLLLQALSEAGPAAEGVAAIDCTTGAVVWETFQYRLLMLANEGVLVRHRMLAGSSGDLISFESGSVLASSIRPSSFEPLVSHVVLPHIYEGVKPGWLQHDAVQGPLFHSRYGELDLWAWHERGNDGFKIRLCTTTESTDPLFTVILEHLPKLLLEPFFVLDDRLFCVTHNNRGILSYELLTKQQ